MREFRYFLQVYLWADPKKPKRIDRIEGRAGSLNRSVGRVVEIQGVFAMAGNRQTVLGAYLFRNWAGASTYFLGLAIGIDLIFDGGSTFAATVHSLPVPQTRTA